MASLRATDSGRRNWLLQTLCPDGRRRSMRFAMSEMQACGFKQLVEALIAAIRFGTELDRESQAYLSRLGDDLLDQLEVWGLIKTAEQTTLATFLDEYIASRVDAKPNTVFTYRNTRRLLVECFGADKPLQSFNEGDGERFRLHMAAKGLAPNTVRRRCGIARQLFRVAGKRKLMDLNPMSGLPVSVLPARSRFHFVTAEESAKVLEHCPDAEWRAIFSLCRWGGLRCPSEVLLLKWEHIDFENGRMLVTCQKTAHHGDGHETRVVPLFPEVRTALEDLLFEKPDEGAVYVINRTRDPKVNWRKRLTSIITRGKLAAWPKLFVNLRSTRATELVETFPNHVVSAWLGHTEKIADRHYRQVTEAHFAKAIQCETRAANALHSGSKTVPQEATRELETPLYATSGGDTSKEWARRESNGPATDSHNLPENQRLDESGQKAETPRAASALQSAQVNAPESTSTPSLERLAAELAKLSEADRQRLAELLLRPTGDGTAGNT